MNKCVVSIPHTFTALAFCYRLRSCIQKLFPAQHVRFSFFSRQASIQAPTSQFWSCYMHYTGLQLFTNSQIAIKVCSLGGFQLVDSSRTQLGSSGTTQPVLSMGAIKSAYVVIVSYFFSFCSLFLGFELVMNALESAAVMERLREGIITYFHHIIPLLMIREQEFLPTPFPNDPTRLPADFPHGDCFHTFVVQWNDIEHQVQHTFEVKLLHFSPEPGERYVTWELVFKRRYAFETRAQIGLLLVDRVLYEDQRLYQITGPLVLVSLGLSVVLTEPAHIRKITLASANPPHTLLDVIQMKCRSWSLELARQEV